MKRDTKNKPKAPATKTATKTKRTTSAHGIEDKELAAFAEDWDARVAAMRAAR